MYRLFVSSCVLVAACASNDLTDGESDVADLVVEDGLLSLQAASLEWEVPIASGRVIVGLLPWESTLPAQMVVSGLHIGSGRPLAGVRAMLYTLPAAVDEAQAIDLLRASGRFLYVDPDLVLVPQSRGAADPGLLRPTLRGEDPLRSAQWNLTAVQFERARAYSRGAGAKVALIDTGVAPGGPDGIRHLEPGRCYRPEGGPGVDPYGHGTAVAGVIAQRTQNAVGTASLAPAATILPMAVVGEGAQARLSDVVDAIGEASFAGAQVIDVGVASLVPAASLLDAVTAARARGSLVVAPAGNEGFGHLAFPAGFPTVLAVGATDVYGESTTYSSYGTNLGIMAPGGDLSGDAPAPRRPGILAEGFLHQEPAPGSDEPPPIAWTVMELDGTSMAAAHVSAAAADLAALGAGPEEISALLRATALDMDLDGPDEHTGAGLLQAGDAVLAWMQEHAPGRVDAVPPELLEAEVVAESPVAGTWRIDMHISERSRAWVCTVDLADCREADEPWEESHTLIVSGAEGDAWRVVVEDLSANRNVSGAHQL